MLLSVLLLFLCFLTVANSTPESGGSEMVEQSGTLRPWEDVTPDILGLIFVKLSLREILNVIPVVCQGWRRVVAGPYCWQEIDLVDWLDWTRPEQVDRLVRMLVSRTSNNLFRRLAVTGIQEETFAVIAEHACSVETLELPRCNISNPIVEKFAAKISALTFLDVSGCVRIGAPALEAIGKNCKSLTVLKRAMYPMEVADMVSQDDEAYAIAATMPKLNHLELANALLTTEGVLQILHACKDLEFLDIRGCWEVRLQQNFLKENHAGLMVLGYWDDSDTSVYSWELSDSDLEELEVRFYGDGFNGAVEFSWPLLT